jgi:hypothetical protein
MKTQRENIVADGHRRYRDARDYKVLRARILTEISSRYAPEKAKASFWRRFWIEVMILHEVRSVMKREFPAGSLYLSAHRKNTPTQATEPTRTSLTIRADARHAPDSGTAHLLTFR